MVAFNDIRHSFAMGRFQLEIVAVKLPDRNRFESFVERFEVEIRVPQGSERASVDQEKFGLETKTEIISAGPHHRSVYSPGPNEFPSGSDFREVNVLRRSYWPTIECAKVITTLRRGDGSEISSA